MNPMHRILLVIALTPLALPDAASGVVFIGRVISEDGFLNAPHVVHAADLDGDGDIDPLAADFLGGNDKIAWFENDGGTPPTFTERVVASGLADPQSIATADMDGDGDLDVVGVTYSDDQVAWYENDGGSPPSFTEHVIPTTSDEPRAVFAADIDGDDDTDVVVGWEVGATLFQTKITWLESDGGSPPSFTGRLIMPSGGKIGAWSVYAEDMDDDGDQDVLGAFWGATDSEVAWYENDGSSPPSWTEHVLSGDAPGATSVVAADINGDGCMDAVSAAWGIDEIAWYASDCAVSPSFTEHLVSTAADAPLSIVAADVNDDGDMDVLSASGFDDTVAWYENGGGLTPTFTRQVISTDHEYAAGVFAADLDGDTDVDVLSVSHDDDKLAWYENMLLIPPVTCPTRYEMLFSVDIGSDTEQSDPFADGDEGFDPGDLYASLGGPVTPPGVPLGRDGFALDDETLFGFDPDPDGGTGVATAVPVGGGCPPPGPPVCYKEYFDLDGSDIINVAFASLGVDPTAPLAAPIPASAFPYESQKSCIFPAEFLIVSFDDDHARSWATPVTPRVPVEGPSPAGLTYGTTAGRDEVMGVNLIPGGSSYPYAVSSSYPVADEMNVHPDLMPNPDSSETDDDDVDALDLLHPCEICDNYLFSPDHEGTAGLIPGAIYERGVVGGGGMPIPSIRPNVHLGLPQGTDVDAFEVVWLPAPGGVSSLAIVFSVDDNDPRTGSVDESGGLDPAVLYASFLTGTHFVLATDPVLLADDVDAITVWCGSIEEQSMLETTLYAVESGGNLLEVDTATGAATLLGDIGHAANGMASDSQQRLFVMYGNEELIEVDPETASGSVFMTLGDPPCNCDIRALAFDSRDQLYVILDDDDDDLLAKIDMATGEYYLIGDTGLTAVQAAGFDACDNLLALDVGQGLLRLDTLTGVATVIGGTGLGFDTQALEFDPLDGTLFAARANLRQVDPGTGDGTLIGATGFTDIRGLGMVASTRTAEILSVCSLLSHGSAGDFCLELGDGTGGDNIEPRLSGVRELHFETSTPVSSVTAWLSCDVSTYTGTMGVTATGTSVEVSFSPALPDEDCCQVDLTGDAEGTWYVRTLAGDVDRSGVVTSVDSSSIKPRFGHPADAANFLYDLDGSGTITSVDSSSVKPRFGNSAPTCP